MFNPEQLATYEEARAIRDKLNSHPLFKDIQVVEGDDEKGQKFITVPNKFFWLPADVIGVGIYQPDWVTGPHGDPIPQIGNSYFLHFRFKNGFKDANVGLIRQKFIAYPSASEYVFGVLAEEYKQVRK